MELSMLMTKLWSRLLLVIILLSTRCIMIVVTVCCQIEVFISFLDSIENLTALVTQLHSLHSVAVLVIHLSLCLMCIINIVIVDEGVWAILRIRISLFHPDCPYTPMLLKDSLKSCLVGQLKPH